MREESGTVGPGSGEGYPAGIDLPQPRASLGPGLRCRADSPPALRRILSLQTRMAIAAAFIACSDPGSADFFVAPDGHDTHPGTRAEPFGTLEAVRDAIRALKRNGAFPEKGLTVWLRGGDYLRVQALELGPEDSGLPDGPVVWRGVNGETARLLGGRRLTDFDPVTNAAVLERLAPGARDHVRECDLRRLGLAPSSLGDLHSRGFGRPRVPAHSELFFDGRPMTLARWPNEGTFVTIAGFPANSAQGDEHGGQLGALADGFYYPGDQPRRWKDTGDLWVHGYWAWDWANSYERVASLDLDRHWVKTAPPHGLYGFRKGQRFYFLNVLEELDEPGEWFLDRPNCVLYFWPPARQDASAPSAKGLKDTLLSILEQPLVRMRGVTNVTLRELVLEATRASAVEIREGAGDRVEGCVLRNVGNDGVVIEGGSDHGVIACDIFDTGDGGVTMSGGDRRTLAPGGHFVENCEFARQGRWSKCYVPAIQMEGVGLRASHNLIHDHPHCAILFGGNDHLIEYNEIHHVALETGDVGAIYTGRDYTYRGNRILHNFIHHTGGVGMGSMGVYMDDCVSGTEIAGNVFYKVQRAAFLGGGRDHRVINNVFVDCHPAVQLDGRGLDTSPVWRGMVDDTMRRSLASVPAALYRAHYPALTDLDRFYGPPDGPALRGDAFHGVPPGDILVLHNVCAGAWLTVGWHASNAMVRVEANLVDDAPGFAGPITDQSPVTAFALGPESPAWNLGFQRIPVEAIGLQEDSLRRNLPQ